MTTHPIITELESRIANELKAIDREQAFRDMIDECYSFDKVGGPFAHMSPSRVLEEVDPVAFRCGFNDYFADGEHVEVNGETYRQDDAERVKNDLVTELESERDEKERTLETLESDREGTAPDDEIADEEIADVKTELTDIVAKLAALESHSF